MSQEPNFVIEHRETKERPLKVTLTRGAKGVYRWEITYYGEPWKDVLTLLESLDNELRRRYGQPELEG